MKDALQNFANWLRQQNKKVVLFAHDENKTLLYIQNLKEIVK